MQSSILKALMIVGVSAVMGLLPLSRALAHCDTMDGPVVKEAQAALEMGDVTPVLKWVTADREEEVRSAFQRTLIVRAKGPEAKELADMYFFETLVRVHRAGEGAPYTGLKPAGAQMEPIVVKSDQALEAGSADELVRKVTAHVEQGIRQRFEKVVEARRHANESVVAGRTFVAAYVAYMHYVEGIHGAVTAQGAHHAVPTEKPANGHDH